MILIKIGTHDILDLSHKLFIEGFLNNKIFFEYVMGFPVIAYFKFKNVDLPPRDIKNCQKFLINPQINVENNFTNK